MSQLRHLFRVTVDGVPYTVRTSARDLATIEPAEGEPEPGPAWTTYKLVHAAMMRLELPVPADLDEFVDVIDDLDDLDGVDLDAAGLPFPTLPAVSATSPSP